jgi:IPT/TIG domain
MGMVHFPQPVTVAMLTPANPRAGYPRYDTPADWSMGVPGNEEDIATRSEPVVNAASTATVTPYPIRTQAAKAAAMVPPLPILDDLGKDYGSYAGQAGRTGAITPKLPYPDVSSPPAVLGLSPAAGLAAGGAAVTISGTGFTGATSVTFGGTAATALVVVDANTITVNAPAHAVGTVDVVVTTPKGSSPTGGTTDNFVYT